MHTCHFFSREELTFCIGERWRADVQNHSFPIRKSTFSTGHVRAMPCRALRGLRKLARGKPICCTCHFPTTKNNISWPSAPVHDETSARRNGAANGAMRNTTVFQLGKHTFRATRPPCGGCVLESRRFFIENTQTFHRAVCVCVIAVSRVQRRGGHVEGNEGLLLGGASLYKNAAN